MNGNGLYTPYLWWDGDQDSNGRLVSYGLGYDFQGVLQGNAKIVSSWGIFNLISTVFNVQRMDLVMTVDMVNLLMYLVKHLVTFVLLDSLQIALDMSIVLHAVLVFMQMELEQLIVLRVLQDLMLIIHLPLIVINVFLEHSIINLELHTAITAQLVTYFQN